MSKILIYGAGLLVAAFVVVLLLFLTFDNAVNGFAIFGDERGVQRVFGPASFLVNFGIVGLVCSFVSYLAYLFSRKPLLLKSYRFIGIASGVFISIGLVWGQA